MGGSVSWLSVGRTSRTGAVLRSACAGVNAGGSSGGGEDGVAGAFPAPDSTRGATTAYTVRAAGSGMDGGAASARTARASGSESAGGAAGTLRETVPAGRETTRCAIRGPGGGISASRLGGPNSGTSAGSGNFGGGEVSNLPGALSTCLTTGTGKAGIAGTGESGIAVTGEAGIAGLGEAGIAGLGSRATAGSLNGGSGAGAGAGAALRGAASSAGSAGVCACGTPAGSPTAGSSGATGTSDTWSVPGAYREATNGFTTGAVPSASAARRNRKSLTIPPSRDRTRAGPRSNSRSAPRTSRMPGPARAPRP